MRIRGGVLLIATVLTVAACNDGTPSPSTPTTPRKSSPTPIPVPTTYPDQDTPIAQAPTALASEWAAYGVTIIPSKHVFDSMPAPPTVNNQTSGAVSNATAQQWAVAFNREGALERWADANDQYAFRFHLMSTGVNIGPEAQALQQRMTVDAPTCFFYYPSMTLFPMDSALSSYFTTTREPTAAKYGFAVMATTDTCVITAKSSGASPSVIDRVSGGTVALFAGTAKTDSVLGPFWFSDSSTQCPAPGAGAIYCRS